MRNLLLLLTALVLAAGCSKTATPTSSTGNPEIESAIQDHLSKRPGLGSMTTEVKAVRVNGDNAEADVLFRSKSNPDAKMTMTYRLKRTNGTWAVERGMSAGGGAAHPDTGGTQPPNPHAPPPDNKPK